MEEPRKGTVRSGGEDQEFGFGHLEFETSSMIQEKCQVSRTDF